MGSGRYSQLLPYSSWLKFNSAQRVHANYVEGIASSLLALLGAGVFYPRAAVVAGFVFMLGREVYGIGYMSSPSGRTAGAILLDVALVAMLGACGVWVVGCSSRPGGALRYERARHVEASAVLCCRLTLPHAPAPAGMTMWGSLTQAGGLAGLIPFIKGE
jgi:uncharacterized membrane protein YecN with MAPEG domain